MITCPNCGRENDESVRLCSFCDHELRQSGAITCPTCGRVSAGGTENCPHCGTSLSGQAAPTAQQPDAGPQPQEEEEDRFDDVWGDVKTPDDASPFDASLPFDDALAEVEAEDLLAGFDFEREEPVTTPAEPAPDDDALVSDEPEDLLAGFDFEREEPVTTSAEPAPPDDDARADFRDLFADIADEPVEPPVTPVSEPEADLPDWFDISETLEPEAEAPAAPPEPPSQTEAAQAAASGEAPQATQDELAEGGPAESGLDPDMPDWLREASSPAAPARPDTSVVSDDWLDETLGSERTAAAGDDIPDWMPDDPTQDAAVVSDSWLDEMLDTPDDGEPKEAAPATEQPPASSTGDLPDWMSNIQPGEQAPGAADAPQWTPEAQETPAEAEQPGEAPDWMQDILAPGGPGSLADDMPDWLQSISSVATGDLPPLPEVEEVTPAEVEERPAQPAPSSQVAFEADDLEADLGEEDMPDWMRDLQPGGTPAAEVLPPPPDDDETPFEGSLFDWLDEEEATLEDAIQAEEESEEASAQAMLDVDTDVDLEAGDLPTWLRSPRPGEGGTIVAEVGPPLSAPFMDLEPGEEGLERLRAANIPGVFDEESDARAEKVGPLQGLEGVVAPASIYAQPPGAGDALEAALEVDSAQVSLLEDVVGIGEGGEVAPAAGARDVAALLARAAVYVALLVGIALPIVTGISPFQEPASIDVAAADAARVLAALGPSSRVLLAFEYDPSQAGELSAGATAVIDDLMTREVTLYAISTQPTGPALAQPVLEELASQHDYTYGEGYLNLGYVSGRAPGVRSLATGSLRGSVSPLAFDYRGDPTGLQANDLDDLELDMIVVLAGVQEPVRVWVEQAGSPSNVPMIAVTAASAEPASLPYYQDSHQLAGILGGLSGATSLTLAAQGPGLPAALGARWNAQVAGALVAALLIVVGGIVHLGVRRQRP